MHTIELSGKVKMNQPLVIPFDLLTQHVGTQFEITVRFKPSHPTEDAGEDEDEWGAEWDELIESIKSRPTPPEYIRPATKGLSREELDELLAGDNNPDFDLEAWNAEWDAYEAEQKRRSFENEQRFLDDMMQVLK